MFGGHLIKSWSSTQPSISLSSGEAEYYGVVKATGIALGHQSLMAEMGMAAKVRVWTDSSAAVGICGRSGLGKLRHVQTHTLWVQERVRSGAIELRKVNGLVNPADLFTKHLTSRDRVNQLIELFNCEYREGRSAAAPELRKDREPAAVHSVQKDYDPDTNNRSPMHDPDVLPHMYDPEEMSKTFEVATAPDELDCAPTGRCICSRPTCRECFPLRPAEFGPPIGNSEAWIIDRHEIEKGREFDEIVSSQSLSEKGREFDKVASSGSLQRVRLPRLLGPRQSSCARAQTSGSLSAR